MTLTRSIVHIQVQLGIDPIDQGRYNPCCVGAAEKGSLSRFVPLLSRLVEKSQTKGAACCDIRGSVLVILMAPNGIPCSMLQTLLPFQVEHTE